MNYGLQMRVRNTLSLLSVSGLVVALFVHASLFTNSNELDELMQMPLKDLTQVKAIAIKDICSARTGEDTACRAYSFAGQL